jgi:hypothetical protein
MRPGYRALLLIGLLAAIVSPGRAGAQAKEQELKRLPPAAYKALPPAPAIACDVSTASVSAGQSVEVTTRVVKGNASGLKYSFASSAGRLTLAGVNANTARLDTAGVSAEEINVTCVVVDPYGRKVSYGKTIRLGTAIADTLLPKHKAVLPPPAPAGGQTEVPEVGHSASPPPPPPPPVLAPTQVPPSGTPPPTKAVQPAVPVGTGSGVGSGQVSGATGTTGTKSATDTGSNEYAEGLAIQQWEKELKTGKIEYNLPTKMSLPDATTVSVVVHGYEDVSGSTLPGAKSADAKVSQRMRVELSADTNPDEFKIESDGTDDVQLVPIDGTATWRWKVTPKQPAADQTLTIHALLVYPDDPNKADVEITSYTAEVSVQVGSLWEWLKYLFWNDPIGLLKYLLPGGAGFAFVAGLVAWWWKRRHPEKKDKE